MAILEPRSQQNERASLPGRQRATLRSVLIGLFLVVTINTWPIYGLYVIHINQMVFSHMAMALMIPFVVLTLGINTALRRYKPAVALSTLELAIIFSMGLIGALFPLMNFTGLILGHMATPYYFASPENRWVDALHPLLPTWLFPSDTDGAMRFFFEGLPKERAFPWDAWVVPVTWWFAFAAAITLASLCMAVLLRRQWADLERLPFPAVQVPLELTREGEGSVWPPLVRSRLFWIGLAVPLFIICWNSIGYFLPSFPTIPITRAGGGVTYLNITRYVPSRYFYVGFHFFIAGFAYWTSLDVLLSIWFFYLLIVTEVGLFNRFGYTIGMPGLWSSMNAANAWQSFGALTFLLGWSLWVARRHFALAWRKVWRGEPTIDDSEELMPYRRAALGLVVSSLFIFGWLHASGMAAHVIVSFLIGLFILYVGIARVIAETGLVYIRGTVMPPSFALFTIGSASIPPATMVTFASSFAYFTDAKSLAMATSAHIAWVTAAVKGQKQRILLALAAAGVVGALTSVIFTLYLGYEHGAYNFRAFEFRTHPHIFTYYVKQMETANPPDIARLGFYAIGILIMAALTAIRYRWPSWPLHPVGFAIMETTAVRGTILTIFLVWLTKLMILRIGGIQLYRRGQPFFLGMLCGFILGVAVSASIDAIWFPGEGHSVHHW